jgi:signal transduction histidine kinase
MTDMIKTASADTENTILIVEDSPTQAEELQYLLEKHGFRVVAARNGREALVSLEKCRPMTVISDIVMPEMDGYELCRRLKNGKELRKIPVILLTSLSDPEDVIMGLECGADYFIMKPYNEQFLLSRIQYILANRHLNGDHPKMGLEIVFRGKKYFINSDRLQILNLLLSTYETAIQKNQELVSASDELAALNEQLEESMAELAEKNQELLSLNEQLARKKKEADEAKFQAETASRAKSDFLANMSHELRTPLNSVIGFSEVLQDEMFGPLTEKQCKYVGNILTSGRHLLDLINDILDLSKVEAGKMELDVSCFPLRPFLDSSLAMLREKALKHAISLTLEVAPEAECVVSADERKLKQVLFNLLSNAVKFTPDGGAVSVRARKVSNPEFSVSGSDPGPPAQDPQLHGDCVEISVEDTGIGIREEDMPKLFREFSQIESGFTRSHEGTGLGLVLAKRMVGCTAGGFGLKANRAGGAALPSAFRPGNHRESEVWQGRYSLWKITN